MLTLPCKKLLQYVPDRYVYLMQLLALSTLLHCLIFGILLCFYHTQERKLNLTINRHSTAATIVFLPAYQSIPGSLIKLAQTSSSVSVQQANDLIQKKSMPAEPMQKRTTTCVKKSSGKLVSKKVSQQKKVELPKQQEKKKNAVTTTKKAEKKSVPKKLEKKIPTKQPVSPKEDRQTEVKKNKPIPVVNNNSQQVSSVANTVDQETVFIGREEKLLLDIEEALQQEIATSWHAPVGLSKDLACVIKVKLHADGSLADLTIEESSGVVTYDIAARSAFDTIAFPTMVWGKEIIITFKQ